MFHHVLEGNTFSISQTSQFADCGVILLDADLNIPTFPIRGCMLNSQLVPNQSSGS